MAERLMTVLEELASCLCGALKDSGQSLCFCGIIHGEPVAPLGGSCESACGMAWVRVISMYPAAAVGEPQVDVGNCAALLGAEVEVGILRCVSIKPADEMPNEAEVLDDATKQVSDAMLMWRAITCCSALGSKDYILRDYLPMGPMGGYGGGSWQMSLAL